ncbi:MAG: DUF58 domain-containing protein [Microscillaceae bacterium]|nr:DUF58 domain-containing protein [Microscillaceae bacterium]
MKAILTKIRSYEIRIRKAVNSQLRGSFSSVFKGTGLEFDDVRAYQYGDDVRRIDWHVSAKGDETFVKVFKEEKEQTVFFLLDVSQSQNIGEASGSNKLFVGKEICSVLALSAVKEESEVGLICFSDQKEKYVKPDKGMKKAYEIMLQLFHLEASSPRTNLDAFIRYALYLIKRRSIVILVSDFMDEGYEESLKSLSRKHDVIIIHLVHPQETQIPRLGLIPVQDKENGTTYWVNTSSAAFQQRFKQRLTQGWDKLENLALKLKANYLRIRTDRDFVPQLVKLFKIRNREAKMR